MKFFFLIYFFFIFLVLSSSAQAIGIAPGKVYVDYVEGEIFTFDIQIIDSGKSEKVSLGKSGFFSSYMNISENEFTFKAGERLHKISVSLQMPPYDSLTEYGPQKTFISARDVADDLGGISASASVKMWVQVDIPFPGKYAIIKELTVNHISQGEATPVKAVVTNRGTDDLRNAKVVFSLTDFQGKTILEQTFSNVLIRVGEEKSFDYSFATEQFDSGIYAVTSTFFYDDGSSIKKTMSYFIGTTDVLLMDYSSDLEKGRINKINLTLQSIWGSPLRNVRLFIISEGKSSPLPAVDFKPFEKQVIDGFIEAPVSEAESLDAVLRMIVPVTYDESIEKNISLTFNLLDSSRKEFPFKLNSTSTLFLVFGVLLLLLVFNIFFFAKKGFNKQESKKNSSKKK